MAGTQTNNFDLVIELAEDALKTWFSALFDGTGPQNSQGNIFEQFFGTSAFTLSLSMDRPADAGLPASATDVVDIRIEVIGQASIRMVVGLVVDRSQPARDRLLVDFRNRLHHLSVSVFGIPIPDIDQVFRDFLSSSFGAVELFGLDVDRSSTDPQQAMQLDFRLIDDTSSEDRDAAALLMNFGGSAGGNRNGFTASILDPGETAGILVFFGWICRIIAPRIEDELELPPGSVVTTATSCEFNGDVVIDEGEDVHLNRLAILLVDDAIRVECRVTKSGFCYSATGTVAADLKAFIENGNLRIDWEAQTPDIEVSIPWECWLVVIAVGAITGGIAGVLIGEGIGGIIGAVAGAVIAGLLTWLLTELLELILEGIGDKAADVVNDISPDINMAVPGLELILQEARIDDLTLAASVRVPQYAPVRCEGTVRLSAGDAVDLDTGTRGAAGLFSADFVFAGAGGLLAQCNTKAARLGSPFPSARRFMLYGLPYVRGAQIAYDQLARFRALPPGWVPTGNVFAYVTTEGRFGVLQATEISFASATLRYMTFGEAFPKASIRPFKRGRGSRWELLETHAEAAELVEKAAFIPSRLNPAFQELFPGRTVAPGKLEATDLPQAGSAPRPLAAPARKLLIFEGNRIGTWIRPVNVVPDERYFRAFTAGLGAGADIRWSVNGIALDQGEKALTVDGVVLAFEVNGRTIKVTSKDLRECKFSLELLAVGPNNQTARASLCITIKAKRILDERFLPTFKAFQKVQKEQFGRMAFLTGES